MKNNKDKKEVLAAVKQDGYALGDADKSLQKDKAIVLAAVKQAGGALQYADKSLRKDKAIVLAAVKQAGYALRYADESLKKDKEVVLAAVKTTPDAIEAADETLKKDKLFLKLMKAKEDYSEISFSSSELTYYDLIVNEKNLDSIEKIAEQISNVIGGGESDSTAHLVLGSLDHVKDKTLSSNYVSVDDLDVDSIDYTIKNKGELVKNPKKGKVVFLFYYYYDHADYVLTKNENFKNICFSVKSFKNEAVIIDRDDLGFEITANDASGGSEPHLEIICSNGLSFRGTVEGKDDLIKEFHTYLTDK